MNTSENGARVHLPRPERIKAAVLRIVAPGEYREAVVRIDRIGEPYGFGMCIDGVCVATAEHPALLSEHAFRNGAVRAVHTYDLRLAE